MKSKLARLIPPLFLISTGMAEVIASTNFDGRTATGNTASGLNWITNGIADPGDMSAFRFDGVAQNLFDATPLAQNNFAPQLNVGNNTTEGTQSWTTSVSLTPLPGTVVTIEGVTFDYVPMNGAGSNQVRRRSDFTFSLLDPSGMVVETFDLSEFSLENETQLFFQVVVVD